MPILPARKAVAVAVKAGQQIQITNTHGKQVVDFWAFSAADPLREYLSMVHTRTILLAVALHEGDRLYSTQRRPLLTLVADTTTHKIHDMMWSACDAERYRMQGFVGYHDNCADNLRSALTAFVQDVQPDFPVPTASGVVPDPLNLFMNVALDHHGGLDVRVPTSEAGQYVVFQAEMDLVVVMSACPQDMAPVNGGKPTDCEYLVRESLSSSMSTSSPSPSRPLANLPPPSPAWKMPRVKIALSVDFDAVSHWLGTGCHHDNNMADYSSGVFAGQVGVYRLLDLFRQHKIADKVTWFIPGHTAETFPAAAKAVVQSGAEVGLHGYAHEGIYQMTEEQEKDVLLKCIRVATDLAGKPPRGYRAPMYTIRETTVKLLREHGFLYDSSLMHHDSQPYFTPADPPIETIDFCKPAASWLHPSTIASQCRPPVGVHPLVELPCGWYNEDMMPMMYLPHLSNSMGYVATRAVEQMWRDKFEWLWAQAQRTDVASEGNGSADFVFPLLVHPDVSGLAHIIGMIDRFLQWLQTYGGGGAIEFCKCEDIASAWLKATEV